MAKTFSDELVEYPAKAIKLIGNDEIVAKLLTNNENLEMDSEEADDIFDKYLFDFGYVDYKSEQVGAYVCVEIEIPKILSNTIKDISLYVTVYCHNEYMKLSHSKFKGFIGNRRDNIVRYIDKLLNGYNIMGIGTLNLDSIRTVNAPANFSAREITYKIPDFNNRKSPI